MSLMRWRVTLLAALRKDDYLRRYAPCFFSCAGDMFFCLQLFCALE